MLQLPAQGFALPLAKPVIDGFYRMGNSTNRGITHRRVSAAIADDLEIRAYPFCKVTSKATEILGCPGGALSDSEAGLGETREEGRIFLT